MRLTLLLVVAAELSGQGLRVVLSSDTPASSPNFSLLFVYSARSTLDEFAPGTRVFVTGDNVGCPADPKKFRLEAYPLGSARAYPASLSEAPTSPFYSFFQTLPPSNLGCWLQAVLPSEIPPGPTELVLTAEGGAKVSTLVRAVPFHMLLFNSGDIVPSNLLATPFTPGSRVVLRTTGAGNTKMADMRVNLGGLTTPLTKFRRSADGTDELAFTVPKESNLAGCYIQVKVTAGMDESNTAMISVMPAGVPCNHPLGLTPTQLSALDAGDSIVVGTLSLTRDVEESAGLEFENKDRTGVAAITGPQLPEASLFGCHRTTILLSSGFLAFPMFFTPVEPYVVGFSSVQLNGPGERIIPLNGQVLSSSYWAPRHDEPGSRWFVEGAWTISATGALAQENLEWQFNLPPPWKPQVDLSRLPQGRSIELTWGPQGYSDGDAISFNISSRTQVMACTADATAGRFRLTLPNDFDLPNDPSPAFSGSVFRLPSKPILRPLHLAGGQSAAGIVTYRFNDQ